MHEATSSISRPYALALYLFGVALLAAYLLAEALAIGLFIGAFCVLIVCIACVLWLVWLRRELAR
ncbi:hypothetical protein [Thermomonas sp.]|uniref:hypothetical protein n=1 Tax=Thermomonas sp. TaxID=1971895 RepID=UPI00391BCB30